MALIPCPACDRQVSEAAPACPGCGHPVAAGGGRTSASFKEALTRPEAVRGGFTVLGVYVAAPWIARILALGVVAVVAIVAMLTRS